MITPSIADRPSLRCVVIDDDPISRHIIEGHIRQTPYLTLIASLTDGVQLLDFLANQPAVDFLLLDVQMPLIDGLDVLRISPKAPAVILTTSQPDFAVEAFMLQVTDYLLKPIEYDRFVQAIDRIYKRRGVLAPPPAMLPPSAPPARFPEDSLFLKSRAGRLVRIPFAELLYVEAVGRYAVAVTSHLQCSSSHLLREVQAHLPADRFVRVHRSYVVNRAQIDSVEESTIVLKGGRTVPIGPTYLTTFLASLG